MAPAEWTEGWERTQENVSDYDNNQPGYITSNKLGTWGRVLGWEIVKYVSKMFYGDREIISAHCQWVKSARSRTTKQEN